MTIHTVDCDTLESFADTPERWLDVRQIERLAPILTDRLELCRDKGFDAVEPDNLDGYDNETGRFTKPLALVLTQAGCWRHTHVAPKDAWARDAGVELRGFLHAVGLGIVAGR